MSLDQVPIGLHAATVQKVEFFQSGNKGTPGVRVFVVFHEYPDVTVGADIWLTEKAVGMARARLKKCGYDPDAGSLRDLVKNPTALRGNEVEVEVVEDEYQGQFRKKLEIPTGRGKPPPMEVLDAFDVALREVKGSRKAPTPTEQEFNEEIPF